MRNTPPALGGGGQHFAAAGYSDALREAVEAGHVALIRTLLAEFGDHIVVNSERSALQVLDCEGAYIAHLPAPPGLVRTLKGE